MRAYSHRKYTSYGIPGQKAVMLSAFLSDGVMPVFLNVYGARESIPRNEFRQPIYVAWGPVR
jgi:hypothetical protein